MIFSGTATLGCALGVERLFAQAAVPVPQTNKSVAIAGIGALAGFGPAVGLTFLAGVLVIGVAVVLGPFAFAFMRIVGNVIARGGLAGMILGYGNREREQRSKEQHSHRGSS